MDKVFKTGKQPSDTFRLGMLLSMVGGFVDAYTFILRGEVLANTQTGNVVLFGLNLVKRNWYAALFYFIPIFSFVTGVVISESIRNRFKDSKIHWRQIVIIMEIIILFVCSFVPMGPLDSVVTVSVSFICSLQVQAFRKTNGISSDTTMCTGNLRNAGETLFYFLSAKDKAEKDKFRKSVMIYFGLIFFFFVGAIVGAFFCELTGEKALLVACLILSLVFAIMFKDNI